MAADAGGADKREHPRLPITLLVQYRFESLDEFVSEYAEDVSQGGMFIRSTDPPEVGSVIFLQFTLRDGSRLVEGLAKVAWRLGPEEAAVQEREPGMGITFMHFDEESRGVIDTIVEKSGKGPDA